MGRTLHHVLSNFNFYLSKKMITRTACRRQHRKSHVVLKTAPPLLGTRYSWNSLARSKFFFLNANQPTRRIKCRFDFPFHTHNFSLYIVQQTRYTHVAYLPPSQLHVTHCSSWRETKASLRVADIFHPRPKNSKLCARGKPMGFQIVDDRRRGAEQTLVWSCFLSVVL